MRWTPRRRIQAALRGEMPDRLPFSVYWLMFPRGHAERQLRNAGVAVVERVPSYLVEMPGVDLVVKEYLDGGRPARREMLKTPVGEVYATRLLDPSYGTSWWYADHFVKQPDDYRVMAFVVRQMRFLPNYDAIRLAQDRWGEDGYVIGNTDYSPMSKLVVEWLGIERFSLDWQTRPDLVLELYELLREKHRAMYPVAAGAPAQMFIYDGNIHQDVVGLKRFEQYYLPCVDAFADELHERGKLSACHLDANMDTLLPAVAASQVDVIEAFTPAPTCDVTVEEARVAWPDKVLWVNFPSSVLIESRERVEEETSHILAAAAPGDRLLLGITEDVPEVVWRGAFRAIADVIARAGRLPLDSPSVREAASV